MLSLAQELGAPNISPRPPLQPGERAPEFALPVIDDDRTVSLADYRGRRALFIALERGLFCPFCRVHIAQLGRTRDKLATLGVDVLSVVGTPPARARAYLKLRPAPVPMAADPMHTTHAAFGLPRFPATPEVEARNATALVNPFGDLPAPRPLRELADELSRHEPYEWTPADQQAYEAGQVQMTGQFLIDRDGVVRWANIEGLTDGLAGIGRFPTEKDLLAAARLISP